MNIQQRIDELVFGNNDLNVLEDEVNGLYNQIHQIRVEVYPNSSFQFSGGTVQIRKSTPEEIKEMLAREKLFGEMVKPYNEQLLANGLAQEELLLRLGVLRTYDNEGYETTHEAIEERIRELIYLLESEK